MQKTVQVVIEIPEDEYKYIKKYGLFGYGVPSTKCPVENAIKNGTVLHKHGRLIDADELKSDGEITIGAGNYVAITRLQIDSASTILESNMVEPQESEE